MASIAFEAIQSADFTVEAGKYPFVILDAKLTSTSNGFKCVELTYEHLGNPKFKINFDKAIYGTAEKEFDMDSKAVAFGLSKLKVLNKVTGLNQVNLDPAIFVKLLPGKKLIAEIKETTNGKYMEIAGLNFEEYVEDTTTSSVPMDTIAVDDNDDPFAR